MIPTIINRFFLIISPLVISGVIVHEAQIDGVVATAISAPFAVVDNNHVINDIRVGSQHIHADSSFSGGYYNVKIQQPATRPRDEDDKKYISQKRITGNGHNSEYSWPSI